MIIHYNESLIYSQTDFNFMDNIMTQSKKKKLAIFISFILFSSINIFSLGIGALGNITPNFNFPDNSTISMGAACSIKLDRVPLVFAISTEVNPENSKFIFGIATDYWLCNPYITNNMKFYIGPGVNIKGLTSFNDFELKIAPRAVFGINYLLLDGFFEIFLQEVVEFGITNNLSSNADITYSMNFPIELGFRFWH